MGLSVGGAVTGSVGGLMSTGAQATQLAQEVQAVGIAMNGASGAGDFVAGGAHVKTGGFDANAEDARADATDAQHRQKSIARNIAMILDGIKDVAASHKETVKALVGAMQTNDQTLLIAASGRMA
jgi:hypothetical protein